LPRAAAIFVILLALAVAGCFGPYAARPAKYEEWSHLAVVASGVGAANATPQQYYVLLVSGVENAQRIKGDAKDPQSICSTIQTFEVDKEKQRVRYDPAVHLLNVTGLRVLVVVDYWGAQVGPGGLRAGCATKQMFQGFGGPANVVDTLRPGVPLKFRVEAQNGFLTYNGTYYLPMGQKIHGNFTRVESSDKATYYVTADFDVVNLGAWLKADISTATNPGKN
jgi:hypothetical protein